MNHTPNVIEIPASVIEAARKETFIHLRKKDEHLRKPILFQGKVVGFCHPHETASGFRLGPIFVLPEFRGKRLTKLAYETYAVGKKCVAYVHHENIRSKRAHIAAGFLKLRRGKGGWTYVRFVDTNHGENAS